MPQIHSAGEMGNKRVVITGLGVITAIGGNVRDFWNGLLEGKCGIKEFDLFDHSDYRTHIAAQVKEIPDLQTSEIRPQTPDLRDGLWAIQER